MQVAKVHAKNILSRSEIGSGGYAINPYVGCPHGCIYCYAEFMRGVTGHKEAWGEFLDAKDFDAASLVKFAASHGGERVFMSSVTDCYNPYEARFGATRKVLETLAGSDVNLQILTKSSLVTRDIDLLQTMPNVRVGVSLSVIDESLRRMLEPNASSVAARIAAIKKLRAAGVKTYIFVAPIFPQITPVFDIISRYGDAADEIWFDRLNLYPNFRDKILAFVGRNFPALLPLYKQIYLFGDDGYFERLAGEIRLAAQEKFGSESGERVRIFFERRKSGAGKFER
ncbi:radical SAM mobile pair protein B [Campylobacter showae]|uniref:Radical SAM domain protein n=1 Tax=Campylobacter showae RM3277 TaxID=553219 RepID=C6RI67_9BACT|nr:radical SAM protein [Campylobacter showae]EET78868.1 radical SAM domain protein [Campylobacter showae RM3277]QCD49321.1 radical SAM mobile pair protein B [Campylobacter showae]